MAGNGGAKKILLVDDDPLILNLRKQILRNLGHQVHTCNSLEKALSAWGPGLYMLIIVDLRRDVQRGLAFCEEIKKSDPGQLVIFLTQPTTYVPPNSCPDEVIPKDQGPEHFVQRVQAVLQAE